MKIVVDAMIPLLEEFFADIGDIFRLDGRSMRAADVRDADVLLVRSVTRVDAGLLAGSRVRFVGTATIGTDHVDMTWLAAQGIGFASAPGCNATAVAEYVMTVLAMHAERGHGSLASLRLGVVGLGPVGRRLADMAQACGLAVTACDPLLPGDNLPPGLSHTPLDRMLGAVDVLSLHVPLTRDGQEPTFHLLNAARLAACHGLLVNTARGAVVDNQALCRRLDKGGLDAVLDVWEQEPMLEASLLARCWLGTPHIAGHSREGKWRGTSMLSEACRQFLGLPAGPDPAALAAMSGRPQRVPWSGSPGQWLDARVGIRRDDQNLRAVAEQGALVTGFDRLRRDRPERREFFNYCIAGAPPAIVPLLAGLGFVLESP